MEHTIHDGRTDKAGSRGVVSRQLQFVETDSSGITRNAGYAPYLDYRPVTPEERSALRATLESQSWLEGDLESMVVGHAIADLVPKHLDEVRKRRADLITRTVDLELERQLSPLPPVAIGGSIVVPIGLLNKLLPPSLQPGDTNGEAVSAEARKRMELLAMQMVMDAERQLGNQPRDVSGEKCGYDIESTVQTDGKLRFIEEKGRVAGALTVTVTRNEILTALNKPDDFILAVGAQKLGTNTLGLHRE